MQYLILGLLVPGVPGGILTSYLVEKYYWKNHYHNGGMEELVFYVMVWSVIFWSAAIVLLAWKLLSH